MWPFKTTKIAPLQVEDSKSFIEKIRDKQSARLNYHIAHQLCIIKDSIIYYADQGETQITFSTKPFFNPQLTGY